MPHREHFGPDAPGAVSMVARRLAGGTPGRPVVLGPAFRGASFPGINFRPVHAPSWLPLSQTHRYALGVAAVLRRMPTSAIEVHNKPDVALWLARLFPASPVSLFLHNDPRTMRGARSARLRGRLIRRLAGIATVSDYIRRMLLEGVPRPAREPVVIHNALDIRELPPITPVAERERVILFAGRVVPDKAPDAFVAACAHALPSLPGWRARIIGADGFSVHSPDTGFVRKVRADAERAGVEMLGFRPHAEVLAAMARAAIVVAPSRWQEPFGLTALEAMACGAALACSNRGGLAEIGGDAGVPIDPDDPEASGRTLARLAQDHAWRATVSANCLRRAQDHFELRSALEKLDRFRCRIAKDWQRART